MTDLGAQPTKTGVRVTSTSGQHADIPAASESHAGVMTAEHVRTLRALDDWKRGIEQGRDAGSAKAAHPLFAATADGAVFAADPRVEAMEARLAAAETRSTASLQAMSSRLQAVESSARRAGAGLTSGEAEKLVASLIDTKLALAPAHGAADSVTPELVTIGARIDDLAAKVARLSAAPDLIPDSREHLSQVFAALSDLNERVTGIETVLDTLKMLAAYKAAATTTEAA